MLKGGTKSFGVGFMRKLKVVSMLKEGRVQKVNKGGLEQFYPVLRGGGGRNNVWTRDLTILLPPPPPSPQLMTSPLHKHVDMWSLDGRSNLGYQYPLKGGQR